jgi:type I restriction enzyme, S subunit
VSYEQVPLRRLVVCLDGRRVPLNAAERADMRGEVPYWGANGVVDRIDRALFDEELILLGEDGAPFSDPLQDVAFRVSGPVWINNHIHALRPNRAATESRFLTYTLNSVDWPRYISGSTRDKLTQDDMNRVVIPLPPLAWQRAIADFLDAETARIDALIKRKRRLGALLQEEEGANIERRILERATGGQPLRRILEVPPQYGATEAGDEGDAGWPRYIRITDLGSDGSLRHDDVKRLRPEIARPYRLEDGDLLFARSGATAGKAFRYRASMGEACFAGYLIRMRVNGKLARSEFVELWTQTSHYWGQILSNAVQSTIQNVNADRYLSLLMPVVHLRDQDLLIHSLTRYRRIIAKGRAQLERQIQLLLERRQALITAAVIGELDIPGAA